jgi:hypothetical protein
MAITLSDLVPTTSAPIGTDLIQQQNARKAAMQRAMGIPQTTEEHPTDFALPNPENTLPGATEPKPPEPSMDTQVASAEPKPTTIMPDTGLTPPAITTAPADVTATATPRRSAVDYLTSREGMINTVLPIMAALESVTTEGKGGAALAQQGFLQDQETRERAAKKAAIEEKLGMQKSSNEENLRKELGAVDMNAPDSEAQIAKIAAKYGDPGELIAQATKLATMKKTQPLTQDDADYIRKNFGESALQYYLANPAEYRKARTLKEQQDAGLKMTPAQLLAATQQHQSLTQSQAQPFGEVDPTAVKRNPGLETIVDQIQNGFISPQMISAEVKNRASGARETTYVMNRLKQDNFNPQEATVAYKFWSQPKTQTTIMNTNNLMNQLPQLQAAIEKVHRLGIPFIDQSAIEALKASGDVNAAQLIANVTATTEDLGRITSGGNAVTNDQLALAGKLFKAGDTPAQAAVEIKTIMGINNARKAAVYAQSGIYGRLAAQKDPFLPADIKQRIANGEQMEGPKDTNQIPAYNSEEEARAAGHVGGEQVKLKGVGIVRLRKEE